MCHSKRGKTTAPIRVVYFLTLGGYFSQSKDIISLEHIHNLNYAGKTETDD